ncbi:hypothetical protein ACFE04_007430 [Oxalis oulophora]
MNMYNNKGGGRNLSWSRKASAEAVAEIWCSGHGHVYVDSVVDDHIDAIAKEAVAVCECNSCYTGPRCSLFLPNCSADANGGDASFLEPFWKNHAEGAAVVISGWHRMGYAYNDNTFISQQLEKHIRKIHSIAGNAVTHQRFIIFGAGATQVLSAALRSLSPFHNSSFPARVFASIPYYQLYEAQSVIFDSADSIFEGDTSLYNSTSDVTETTMIEYVTSPNNPDGLLNKAVLSGSKAIHDRAYYWPHYTPIPAPADDDLMIFTLSKLTGHCGSRFGWALIKDEEVYKRMLTYMQVNSMGVSKDTQLRALALLKEVLKEDGREIFDFAYNTMKQRWEDLKKIVATSNRFSLQPIENVYCSFSQKVREASPAYAWIKCESEEDKDCYAVLKAANIIGRAGSDFHAENRYARLALIRSQDDFDLLLDKLKRLVSQENGAKVHLRNAEESKENLYV